jgi:hypothetical protein
MGLQLRGETPMRQQLIEALLYPRKIVEELIQEGNYAKKNMFEATGERCNHCDGSGNCGWDQCVEDFTQLGLKTDEALNLPHVDPPGVVHPD